MSLKEEDKADRYTAYIFLVSRFTEYIERAEKMGAHQQYIEGLKDALDIIKDEME